VFFDPVSQKLYFSRLFVRPSRNHKSTQLSDFVYSSYSSSFATFITSIHRLHEPSFYKEADCNPLWQKAMVRNLLLYIILIYGI